MTIKTRKFVKDTKSMPPAVLGKSLCLIREIGIQKIHENKLFWLISIICLVEGFATLAQTNSISLKSFLEVVLFMVFACRPIAYSEMSVDNEDFEAYSDLQRLLRLRFLDTQRETFSREALEHIALEIKTAEGDLKSVGNNYSANGLSINRLEARLSGLRHEFDEHFRLYQRFGLISSSAKKGEFFRN